MRIINLCIIMSFTVLTSCQKPKTNIPKTPNILFILADDLGAMDLSCTGSTYYETPNIDTIAQLGIRFTNGYATSRVCSPSRASIMTGKFTARHGITDWIGAKSGLDWRSTKRHDQLLPANYVHDLPEEDITLAEALKQNGYTTFFAGKWHLGKQGSYPEDHGFDINVGGWEKGSPAGGYFSPWKNPRLENHSDGEQLSIRLAKETVQFIEKHKDTSFFAMLSFYAVHAPIQTTEAKWAKYQQKATQNGIKEQGYQMQEILPIRQVQDHPVYAGLLETMDDAVGLVLQSLKKLGLAHNTIVIFTSDNGGVASGDAYATSNLPLRGGKGYSWEGGIKTPYFIYVPWIETKTIAYPVTGADFYPTILDLAKLNLLPDQHKDGISLKPLIEGKTYTDRPLFWHYPHYGNQGGSPSSIIREGHWKLIHYWEQERNELYDLNIDPYEHQELSDQFPNIEKQLYHKLIKWLDSVHAHFPIKDITYSEVLAKKRKEQIINELWPMLERQRKAFLSKDFSPNKNWWGSQTDKDH